MRSHPGIDGRGARALPWRAALSPVSVVGVSPARAADAPAAKPAGAAVPATKPAEPAANPAEPAAKPPERAAKPVRPPISPTAVKQATEAPAPQKAAAASRAPSTTSQAAPDSGMTLRGGQEGTDFRTMTV